MRIRNAVVLIIVSLVIAITFSVTGQEEALPVVRAKDAPPDAIIASAESYASLRPEPTLYLSVEPIRALAPITIAEAARNNDWVTFNDLYVKAQNRGEDVSQFQSLHELWSWSLSDPIGAFYGREIYDRLARAYPGFAEYISEFVLIDRRGNAFYPTAETRAFLLERATRGAAPRVLIASAEPAPRPAAATSTTTTRRASSPTRTPAKRTAAPAPKPSPTPIETAVVDTPPVVISPQPAPIVAEQPKVAATTPAPAPAPARTVAEPVPAPQTAIEPARVAVTEPAESNDLRNRGILLLIIGLLGVGILAVILRAPKEEPRPIIDISEKVHPIRKAGTTPDEHRATGSHG